MHPAYNYGEAILNSEEYKKYIPDYYLTYGDYWNNQIKYHAKLMLLVIHIIITLNVDWRKNTILNCLTMDFNQRIC